MFKKIKLVRIGNSKGVQIPKPFIEEIGVGNALEKILRENETIPQPTNTPSN